MKVFTVLLLFLITAFMALVVVIRLKVRSSGVIRKASGRFNGKGPYSLTEKVNSILVGLRQHKPKARLNNCSILLRAIYSFYETNMR